LIFTDFYDQGIKYLDERIGDLIEFLKKENIYQDTIIVLVADHGDEFLEHQGGGHTTNLYNEILKVPLLIKIPGENSEKIDRKISLIDLSPTICYLAGIDLDPSFKGKNLLNSKEEMIFHQTAVNPKDGWNISFTDIKEINQCKMACQSDKWKYIINYGTQEEELYDLQNDPKEKNNILKTEPKILSQMRERMKEFKKENPPLSLVNKI
jgi:arylsulfatase A-like enzyme